MLSHLVLQNNGVPIYVQLREQIAAALGRGLLAPGERLPTMREAAVALRIDLNTVQRAYGELDSMGDGPYGEAEAKSAIDKVNATLNSLTAQTH